MLKKIVIEKLYLLVTILALGLWGALNMLQMEHESIAEGDSGLMKSLVGVNFLLMVGYLLVNYKYVHLGRIGERLLFICVYMAITRAMLIPLTASAFAYIYQPILILYPVLFFPIREAETNNMKLQTGQR